MISKFVFTIALILLCVGCGKKVPVRPPEDRAIVTSLQTTNLDVSQQTAQWVDQKV